jgi:hypothetical protein
MDADQTQAVGIPYRLGRWQIQARLRVDRRRLARVVVWAAILLSLGSSALPSEMAHDRLYASAVTGWGFDLVEWEAAALWEKAVALVEQPAAGLDPVQAATLVQAYLARAARLGELEGMLANSASRGGVLSPQASEAIYQELTDLRRQQAQVRPTVEQVIQGQVGWVLKDEGFGVGAWPAPPVQFTFTEPPKKLVVSPRDRIDTIYSQMLAAAMGVRAIKEAEATIEAQPNSSAYITEIGGLGAYPTMVVDRASLRWVLSTVVHEWTHNYLVFFPLGWNYFKSQDLTTLNETVAEVVGNEVGDRTLALYFPEIAAAAAVEDARRTAEEIMRAAEAERGRISGFDFQAEMRETRLEVDRLLAAGKVAEAEQYMAQRRAEFLANGYALRVLNQAYFAFHGSYGTSAASTSPIGPKLEQLRSLMPDLATFLHTVRWFTSTADLDAALAEWEARADP